MDIILGIPGGWETQRALRQEVVTKSDGLILLEGVLLHLASNEKFKVEIYDYEPNLKHSFELAGGQSLTVQDLARIDSHTFTVYLIGEGGSPDRAQRMMQLASGLLQAGGLGVKVETSGVAHSPNNWTALASRNDVAALYEAFVTLVQDGQNYYSCGMHNLGHRDALLVANTSPKDAARTIEIFLKYCLLEKPSLKNGQTFSVSSDAPKFKLEAIPCSTYPSDDFFFNPYGMWKLEDTAKKRWF